MLSGRVMSTDPNLFSVSRRVYFENNLRVIYETIDFSLQKESLFICSMAATSSVMVEVPSAPGSDKTCMNRFIHMSSRSS